MAKIQPLQGMSVKRVFVYADTTSRSYYRPFKIGLGRNQALLLRKVIINYVAPSDDLNSTLYWMLIQKDERESDFGYLRSMATESVRRDNDVLSVGLFHNVAAATGANRTGIISRQENIFEPPFIVARSPSMEFNWGAAVQSALTVMAELYYSKIEVTQDDLLKLMKRYVGRKQDVVSNIPRVIDE